MKKQSAAHKREVHRRYMELYLRRKREAGLCSRCLRPNDRPGLAHCSCCSEKMKLISREHRAKKYGLSLSEFRRRIMEQDNRCALCDDEFDGSRDPAVVDHDHHTGQIRGIIHRTCNQGIGLLGDTLEGVTRAASYLSRQSI